MIIDANVYLCSRGIRMFGSRKVGKGEDLGRIYEMIFAVNKTGEIFYPDIKGVELMKEISIHEY